MADKFIALFFIALVAIVVFASFQYAFALDCYDKFVFNWFTANDVLLCLNDTAGTSGVSSVTATSPIVTSSATGDITLSCPTCITSSSAFAKYELLCSNTLVASGNTLSCNNFTARQHLILNINVKTVTNTVEISIQFNGDTGNNYARRISFNGGADSTTTNANQCQVQGANNFSAGASGVIQYVIKNVAGDRKMAIGMISNDGGSGSGTAPSRVDSACEWDNTSDQITSISLIRNSGTGSYDIGTEISVLGYD